MTPAAAAAAAAFIQPGTLSQKKRGEWEWRWGMIITGTGGSRRPCEQLTILLYYLWLDG